MDLTSGDNQPHLNQAPAVIRHRLLATEYIIHILLTNRVRIHFFPSFGFNVTNDVKALAVFLLTILMFFPEKRQKLNY